MEGNMKPLELGELGVEVNIEVNGDWQSMRGFTKFGDLK